MAIIMHIKYNNSGHVSYTMRLYTVVLDKVNSSRYLPRMNEKKTINSTALITSLCLARDMLFHCHLTHVRHVLPHCTQTGCRDKASYTTQFSPLLQLDYMFLSIDKRVTCVIFITDTVIFKVVSAFQQLTIAAVDLFKSL